MNTPTGTMWTVVGTLVLSGALSACGGSDGGGGGTPPVVAAPSTGAFIDSPVQGLPYGSTPSGLSGLTGPKGEFLYRPGDSVTFHMGGMTIGTATGQPQITPFTLLGRTSVPSVTHEWPVNLAQLLLALDTVAGSDAITLPTTLPTIPSTTCFSCSNFDTEMAAAGIPIVAEADAIAHLQKQFAIWGSWATAVTPSELQVVTFLPDGTFILAHDDDPLVAGGTDGMERGTYRWNATTNEFTYAVAVNTDGTGGLSNPSATQTPPYTFVIDPSGNSAVFHFGPNVSDQIAFTRVIDATKLFVGAWKLEAPIADFSTVLTVFSDGTFTVASDATDTDPAGMERGTYVYDAIAGKVTFTTTVDTNGAFGVNDSPTLPAVGVVQATIEQSLGQFDFLYTRPTPSELVVFDRVRVP
jgi:hypothetical protein